MIFSNKSVFNIAHFRRLEMDSHRNTIFLLKIVVLFGIFTLNILKSHFLKM